MTNLRWYPSSTVLPDGKVITLNGSRYDHWYAFGGRDIYGVSLDSLFRATSTSTEAWDPPVLPYEVNGGNYKPDAREGMSVVPGINGWDAFIFGGRDTSTSLFSQHFSPLFRDPVVTTLDYSYHWSGFNFTGSPPSRRAFHAAVDVPLNGDTTAMIIIGGLDQSGPLADVKSGSFTSPAPNLGVWAWNAVLASGSSPGPRYAHEAVYVPTTKRIYVFGGTDGTNADPHDSDVWSMSTDALLDHQTTSWVHCTLIGTARPAPRVQHTFVGDQVVLKNAAEGKLFRAFLYGGRTKWLGTPNLDTLWTLWFKGGPGDAVEWVSQPPPASGPWPGFRARHGGLNDSQLGYQLVLAGGDVPGSSTPDNQFWIGAVPLACDTCRNDTQLMQWVQGQPMPRGRTGLRLIAPKTYFTNSVPEIYDPTHGAGSQTQWTQLTSAFHRTEWYPFAFSLPRLAAPSAKSIFVAGPDTASWLLDLAASSPTWVAYPPGASSTLGNIGGSAVMYRPGKIMKCGSRDTEGGNAVGLTESIDLNAASPSWKASVNTMAWGRTVHNLVILPTGEVLVVGGLGFVNDFVDSLPVYQPEIWNPDYTDPTGAPGKQGYWYGANTGEAHPLDSSSLDRDYHSNALLLPDGRVLCAGGNTWNDNLPPNRLSHASDYVKVDLYSPPYLFVPGSTDSGAVRPTLASPPAGRMCWGNIFTIATPNAATIQSVSLIKAGASTHGFNEDQRYVPLSFARATSPSRLFVTMPADSTIAPPGPYMLFMVDSSAASGASRVPSVATWMFAGDRPGRDSSDVIRPAISSDLEVDVSTTQVFLSWADPADDTLLATSGMVTKYDGRRSALALDNSNWSYATPITIDSIHVVGHSEFKVVTGLSACTTYHFGVRALDDNANESLAYDVPATTLCGGGGGGAAAQQAPGRGAHGASSARLTATPGGVVVIETRRCGSNGWTITAHDDSTVAGLGVPDSAGIYIQVDDGSRQWSTSGGMALASGNDALGPSTLRDGRRLVLVGGWEVQSVAAGMLTGHNPYALTTASQGTVGNLGADFVASGGAVSLGVGDSLVLNYQGASAAPADSNNWYLLAAHTGAGTFSSRQTGPGPGQGAGVPVRFALHQNQPNPFGGVTGIQFDLPIGAVVRLEIFDSQGRRLETLANQYFPPGYHAVNWDPASSTRGHLGPGVYFYRIQAGRFRDQKKMVLLTR